MSTGTATHLHHPPAHDEPTLAPTVTSQVQDRRRARVMAETYKKESFSISTKLVSRRKESRGKKPRVAPSTALNHLRKKRMLSSGAPPIITIPTFWFVHDENTLPSHDCEHRGHRGSALPGAACHMS